MAERSAFGVADARLGEEVALAVVARDGESPSAEALREHMAGVMARHKAPRYIWILGEPLPRNACGKFLRRELARPPGGVGGGLKQGRASTRLSAGPDGS